MRCKIKGARPLLGLMWLWSSMGCASTPAPRSPDDVPLTPARHAAASPTVNARIPNASQDASGDSPSLLELLAHAEAHAPAIELARARMGIQDAEQIEASIKLPDNPTLSTSAGLRSAGSTRGFQFEVTVKQQFEIAREAMARQHAAAARRRVADALIEQVSWQVRVETRRLYRQILLANVATRQATSFVEFSRRWQALVQAEIDAGESSPLLARMASVELAQTRARLLDARRHEAALRARLAALVGWPEPEVPLTSGTLPKLVGDIPSFDALLSKLEASHPELRQRELEIEAQRARLDLARREAWIKPSLGVSYGQEPSLGQGFDANIWLVKLDIPLPTWRRNQSGVAMASANVAIADRARAMAFMTLREELFEARTALEAAYQRVKLYEEDVVPELEATLEALQQAYDLGELEIHAVLQMRKQLLDAAVHHQAARRDYDEALAQIEALTGWNESEVER